MADTTTDPANPLPVSPTGKAVVPGWVTKVGTFVVLLAGAVILEGQELGLVLPAVVMPWVKLIYLGGTVLGIVSPGWRKAPDAPAAPAQPGAPQ